MVYTYCMDGRKIDHKTREQIRIMAVERVEAGESPEEVIATLGFHRSCIYDWLAKYREGGKEALKTRKISGRPPKLSGRQLKKVYELVTLKSPRQLKFEFALWTRDMVRELIRRQFGVKMSVTTVGRLLRKLGLSPQRPLRRAYQQDPEAVERWKKEAGERRRERERLSTLAMKPASVPTITAAQLGLPSARHPQLK